MHLSLTSALDGCEWSNSLSGRFPVRESTTVPTEQGAVKSGAQSRTGRLRRRQTWLVPVT